MSHAIQNIAFAVNNLFQGQHAGVIKPTGRLGSAIHRVNCGGSFVVAGVALLFACWGAVFAVFGVLLGRGRAFSVGAGGESGAPVSCYNDSRDI